MYCPILCINPKNGTASFGQCLEAACAWWIITGDTGQCAICRIGGQITGQ